VERGSQAVTGVLEPVTTPDLGTCSIGDCTDPLWVISRGLCQKHYSRWWRWGDPTITKQLGPTRKSPGEYPTVCTIPDCGGKHRAHGYCGKHYLTFWRYGDAQYSTRTLPGQHPDTCEIDACERKWFCRGFCRSHYESFIGGATRRARIKQTAIPFTAEQLNQKLSMYGGKCWMCRVQPYEAWDHVKPLAKGGAHILANLRPACKTCNSRKIDKWPL
jgi:hypothetical protein